MVFLLLFFLFIKELKALNNIRGKFILAFVPRFLFINYNILYYPPMYISYINKVKIPNRILSNHQAYNYYDGVKQFTYDFKGLTY